MMFSEALSKIDFSTSSSFNNMRRFGWRKNRCVKAMSNQGKKEYEINAPCLVLIDKNDGSMKAWSPSNEDIFSDMWEIC